MRTPHPALGGPPGMGGWPATSKILGSAPGARSGGRHSQPRNPPLNQGSTQAGLPAAEHRGTGLALGMPHAGRPRPAIPPSVGLWDGGSEGRTSYLYISLGGVPMTQVQGVPGLAALGQPKFPCAAGNRRRSRSPCRTGSNPAHPPPICSQILHPAQRGASGMPGPRARITHISEFHFRAGFALPQAGASQGQRPRDGLKQARLPI